MRGARSYAWSTVACVEHSHVCPQWCAWSAVYARSTVVCAMTHAVARPEIATRVQAVRFKTKQRKCHRDDILPGMKNRETRGMQMFREIGNSPLEKGSKGYLVSNLIESFHQEPKEDHTKMASPMRSKPNKGGAPILRLPQNGGNPQHDKPIPGV